MTATRHADESHLARMRTGVAVCLLALGAAALAHWSIGIWLSLALGAVVGALYWTAQRRADRDRQLLLAALDAMQAGVVLYGPDDRLRLANADFRRLYDLPTAALRTGMSFEELLRSRVQAGLVPEAAGREDAWVAERVEQHRRADTQSFLRQMADGRWRRITEQRLADGSRLGFSIDVTDLVEREQDLARARAEAEQAHRHLRDAIEAIPAGIEIYDESDRLVIHNRRLAELYPHVSGLMRDGQRFEDMVRRSLSLGLIPAARGREEAWLAQRLARRGSMQEPLVQPLSDGTWLQIHEVRGASGSIVGVRLDVTDLVRQREELTAARARAEAAHALLHDAIEAMPAAVEVYDADDRLVLFNRRMLSLYPHMDAGAVQGQTFEALAQRALAQGKVPAARGREQAWLDERMAVHATADGVPRLQQASDGSWIHIYETRIGGGGIVVVRVDVSEVVRQSDAHRQARELLDDAIEALPDGFALFDAEDRMLLCNQRYRDIYPESAPAMRPGASFEEIVSYGLARGQYLQVGADADAWLAERLRRHRDTDGTPILQPISGERWLRIDERRTRSGGIAGVRTDVTELMQARDAAETARRQAQDIAAALRQANADLETLSATDALTGIANRRRFEQRLGEELGRVKRYAAPLSLLLVDVDYFKRYNDRHGHPQGDRALQQVAGVLAAQARRPGELAARFGGEEFVVLLPHADAAAALALAERCREAVAALALPHGNSPVAPHVTISIGVAEQASGEDAGPLIKRADMALYAAKAAGRNRAWLEAPAIDAP